MKNKVIFLFVLLFSFSLYAEVSLNPNDKFYNDAKNWEIKGIISKLPQIRPYSVKTIKFILNEVLENGDDLDKKKAQKYLDKYFSKPLSLSFKIGDSLKVFDGDVKNMFYVQPEIFGNLELFNYINFGYKLGIIAQNTGVHERTILPQYVYSLNNIYDDKVNIGSMVANLDMLTNVSIGNEKMYGMFGIYKTAFGPFLGDSVLLNGTQFHSGNFSFVINQEKWSYTKLVSALSRSLKDGNDRFSGFKPEKFLGFHSLSFTPFDKLTISYFEASIFCNRFDPCYFLPVPYMVLQGMYGASDNAVNGLSFEFKPIPRLSINSIFSFDDVDINGFAKGDFNSRLKVCMQVGASYIPEVSFVNNLSFDYTLITPYTYSHCDPQMDFDNFDQIISHYNKDNYTTQRTNLGTRLPPNSDRIQFKSSFSPNERLQIDVLTAFIRHANIAESFTDEEAQQYIDANNAIQGNGNFSTDGSVWTSPLTLPSSDRNNFMAQEHKMYVLQLGVDVEYELERQKWGNLIFTFGYMFEYIYNKGVDSNIYVASSLTPQESRDLWVEKFYNVINNYLSISIKYVY